VTPDTRRLAGAAAAGALFLGGWAVAGDAAPTVRVGRAERSALSLTIYSDDLALVREARLVTLPEGLVTVQFTDTPSGIEPRSVQVRFEGDAGGAEIREQSFRADVATPERLLELSVGHEVILVTQAEGGREVRTPATLLSVAGGPIFRIGDEIQIGHPGRVVLPSLPDGSVLRPTLEWLLRARRAGAHRIEAGYLTSGLSWSADYVLRTGPGDGPGRLACWVTVDNRTGSAFDDARLELVAGTVNRVEGPRPEPKVAMMRVMAADADGSAPEFAEQGLSEYRLYTLGRPVSLAAVEEKQLLLLEADDIPMTRRYVARGGGYMPAAGQGEPQRVPVEALLEFENTEKGPIGRALPAGVVRIYEDEADGGFRFLGEDRIRHTPAGESVSLRVGQSQDLIAERRQTDFQQRPRGFEAAWEIRVRNHRAERVTVDVRESLPGDWRVLESSHPWHKRDASTISFPVDLSAGAEATLTYRIRVD
jgi:hypothetical protein